MRGGRVGDSEGHQMKSRMPCERGVEFARKRRGSKADARERTAGGFSVAHEMREVIEKDFSLQRKLAVGFG